MRLGLRWILFFAILSCAFAGTRPLWEPDEGRYAESAREMLVSGDWIMPTLEGHPHLTKPPFVYWMIGAGLKIFGVNTWGARAALSLAFFFTILSVAALAHVWATARRDATESALPNEPLPDNAARAAGLIFATSLLPFICGHALTTDMFLTFWETLGVVLCAWKVWTSATRVALWRIVFWVAFGFAFVTKGPPGWLPLLVIVIFRFLRPAAPAPRRLWSWTGFVLFLVIAFGWFITLRLARGVPLSHFIHDEVYDRIFTDAHRRDKSWVRYLYIVPLGLTPWLFLWPNIVSRLLKKTGMIPQRNKDVSRFAVQVREGFMRLSNPELFSILWFTIPFLIFCYAKSRMPLYVVPLMVPISIWGARVLLTESWLRRFYQRRRSVVVAVAGVWCVVLMLIVCPPAVLEKGRDYRGVAQAVAPYMRQASDRLYSIDSPTPYSISFYSGMPIESLDVNFRQLYPALQSAANRGAVALMLIKHNDMDQFENYPDARWRIVAENEDHLVCEILANGTLDRVAGD